VSNPQQPFETGNSFLDTLPLDIRSRFQMHLEPEHLKQGAVLGEPGVPVDQIYFPVRGVISTVASMSDGNAVEVGFAGHDGFSSIALAFGRRETPHTTVVQIAGSVLRMPAHIFLHQSAANAELHARALAYGEYSFIAATQFAACNRLHAIEGRYARWLLMADDRVGGAPFMLTQEYAAEMLGVRRASVTLVAGTLSAAGAISYRRGNIQVLNRDRLLDTACECYGAVNDELQRLMGYSVRFDPDVEQSA
jgi:CRP-like cAMP-binding protein